MPVTAREHVGELATVFSVASLALVFGAVLGLLPISSLPRAPAGVIAAIPHGNAIISLAALVVISYGWYSIRRNRIRRHRTAMLGGALLFAAFLVLYLYKVALEGPTPFDGPDVVYRFVYLPILVVHMTLAVVCVPLLYYVLLIGLTHPPSEIPRTRHRQVGRIAAALWLASFALGLVVYSVLYLPVVGS